MCEQGKRIFLSLFYFIIMIFFFFLQVPPFNSKLTQNPRQRDREHATAFLIPARAKSTGQTRAEACFSSSVAPLVPCLCASWTTNAINQTK